MNDPANDVVPTVRQAWTLLLTRRKDELEASTHAVYERLQSTLGELGNVRIDQLRKPQVYAWHRRFGEVRSTRTGRTRRSQGNAARHVLGLVCEMAELEGWRSEGTNPVRGVPRFKVKPRERFLDEAECHRLFVALDKVETDRVSRFYATPFRQLCAWSPTRLLRGLYLCGQRTFALASLLIANVDVTSDRPTMRVEVKGKGMRTFPIAPELAEFFRDQIRRVGNLSPWMFPGTTKAGHVGGVYHVWRRVCAEAGIVGLVPHGLRHSAACQLLIHGVPRNDVAAFLDDDQKVLDDHYDHVQITPRHRHVVDKGTRILAQLAAGQHVDDGYRPLDREEAA